METAPYYHAVIGDVDIKTKIVSVGQPGEGVTVHCSRHGRHMPWNAETELQAREVISWLKERFAGQSYKLIPVPAPQGLGLKIHPVHTTYPGKETQDKAQAQDIFDAVRGVMEEHTGKRVFMRHRTEESRDHNRPNEHALHREIERIIRASGHVETKVRDIVRLINV